MQYGCIACMHIMHVFVNIGNVPMHVDSLLFKLTATIEHQYIKTSYTKRFVSCAGEK